MSCCRRIYYYPFGMEMEGPWELAVSDPTNSYTYNGKELQGDFGLDWLDYGARFYDPSIGRFSSIDPLSDEFPSWTPYHYVHNNPLLYTDPTGMSAEQYDWIENGDGTWTAEEGDGAETLAQDAGISKERAYEIMEEQGYGTYVDEADGVTKSAIDPGQDVTISEHVQVNEELERDNTTLNNNSQAISKIDKTVDSLKDVKGVHEQTYELQRDHALQNDKFDPGTGTGLVRGIIMSETKKLIDQSQDSIDKLNTKKDSLQKDSKKIKNGEN